jgi:hypothetical protein
VGDLSARGARTHFALPSHRSSLVWSFISPGFEVGVGISYICRDCNWDCSRGYPRDFARGISPLPLPPFTFPPDPVYIFRVYMYMAGTPPHGFGVVCVHPFFTPCVSVVCGAGFPLLYLAFTSVFFINLAWV